MDAHFETRFWSKVNVLPCHECCWEWLASRNRGGYGKFQLSRKSGTVAHRVARELAFGPITDGLHVRHTCDNRACCNPHHLLLGTTTDNTRDRVERGRNADRRGEKAGMVKLTEEQARAILAAPGARGSDLAQQYGVSQQAICDLRKGRTWPHIHVNNSVHAV